MYKNTVSLFKLSCLLMLGQNLWPHMQGKTLPRDILYSQLDSYACQHRGILKNSLSSYKL